MAKEKGERKPITVQVAEALDRQNGQPEIVGSATVQRRGNMVYIGTTGEVAQPAPQETSDDESALP